MYPPCIGKFDATKSLPSQYGLFMVRVQRSRLCTICRRGGACVLGWLGVCVRKFPLCLVGCSAFVFSCAPGGLWPPAPGA